MRGANSCADHHLEMEIIEFCVLSVVNLSLIGFIIRKWSLISAEGLCMAYLGMAVLTDNAQLLFHYVVSPAAMPLGYREFAFRIYPTEVHIVGLVVLIVGLSLANGNPRPVAQDLSQAELHKLRRIGVAVAVVGGILGIIALFLVGAPSAPSFYGALNTFRDEAVPFGGFWYRGADIAVFGLALTLPSLGRKKSFIPAVLLVMLGVSFFMRTNKGGFEEPILWAGIVLCVYNRDLFKSLWNIRLVALVVVITFLGVGAKTWLLPRMLHQESSSAATVVDFFQLVRATTATRWGDDSLYRGYCQFVNALPDNQSLFRGSKVGVYALTSWVPRLIDPNKPDHPFRGLGYMIYSDYHAYPAETPAPTLVGSALADAGFASLVEYLLAAAIFLSLLRRWATRTHRSLYCHVGYMLFVVFGGLSADEGILGTVYTLFLAYAVIAAGYLMITSTEFFSIRAHGGLSSPRLTVGSNDNWLVHS